MTVETDRVALVDMFASQIAPLSTSHLVAAGQRLASLAGRYALDAETHLLRTGVAHSSIAAPPEDEDAAVGYLREAALTALAVPIALELLAARGWRVRLRVVEPRDGESAAWVLVADGAPDDVTAGWNDDPEEDGADAESR